MPDSIEQKAKTVKKEATELLQRLREEGLDSLDAGDLVALLEPLLEVVAEGSVRALVSGVKTLLQGADRAERLRFHMIIGNVLAEELGITPYEGKLAAYYLISPEYMRDIAANQEPSERLLQMVEQTLLGITLRYELRPMPQSSPYYKRGAKQCFSTVELYLLRKTDGEPVTVHKEITSELDRYDVLGSVREAWIREGDHKPVVYKLFPRRAE